MNNSLKIKIIASVILISMLAGCMPNEAGKVNKANIGMAGGAVAGALLGATVGKGSGNAAAIAAGTLLAAIGGKAIGELMDQQDMEKHNAAQLNALEYNKSGHASTWHNPDTGSSGSITPVRTYYNNSGENCREYRQKVIIGSKTEEAYGKACRRSNGAWEIIS